MNKKTRYIRIPNEIVNKSIAKKPFEDIMVVSAGYRCGSNKNIGYNVERHPGEEYLVKYCIYGYGWLETQGVKYKVGPGDIVVCGSCVSHKYGADTDNPWSVYWAYYKGKSAEDYYEWMFSSNGRHVLHIGYDGFIEQHFKSIIAALEKGYASHYMLHASNMLKSILSHLIINPEPSCLKNKKESELEKIIQFMLDNLDKTVTLERMARKTGMSKDHFIKVFSKKYGYTPIDYFIRMKIQKACELLATTDYNISRIAEILGYTDCYYFSRLFKNKTDVSPSRFRKNFFNEAGKGNKPGELQ